MRRVSLLASLFALVAVTLVNAVGLGSSNEIIDDAFIFFRYVDNMLAGHGLLWNPGEEPVEGYSSFLYVMVLALPRAFGADLVVACHVLNVGLYLFAVLLSLWTLSLAAGGWRPSVLIAPFLVAASGPLATFARNGMESLLFVSLNLFAVHVFVHRAKGPKARFASGLLFGLVGLTRPEGILVYLVCLLLAVWQGRAEGRPWRREELERFLGLVSLMLPHWIWRLLYYGEPLPNTYYAKVGFAVEHLQPALLGFTSFLGTHRGVLAALGLVLWMLAPRTRMGDVLTSMLVMWLAYVALFLRLPSWVEHYTAPVDLFAPLSAGWSLSVLVRNAPTSAGRLWLFRAALIAGTVFLAIGSATKGFQRRDRFEQGLDFALIEPEDHRYMVNQFIAVGQKLGELHSPGETVAVGAVGAIAYYSGMTAYDTMGLNDKHIARQPVDDPGASPFGHEKGDGRYILGKKPTYLIPIPFTSDQPNPGLVGISKTFTEIFALPQFRRNYEFQSVQLENGRYFNYYKRRTGRRGPP